MPPDADDLLAEQLRKLRREYLADSVTRVEELRQLRAQLAQGDLAALVGLRRAFHRLAGSGGSYGFPAVSSKSRDGERVIQRLESAGIPVNPGDISALDQCVEDVANAFADARNAPDVGQAI